MEDLTARIALPETLIVYGIEEAEFPTILLDEGHMAPVSVF
jgi:hypothetical protein